MVFLRRYSNPDLFAESALTLQLLSDETRRVVRESWENSKMRNVYQDGHQCPVQVMYIN
jgi:hypothetical protein